MTDPLVRFAKAYCQWRQTPPSVVRVMLKPGNLPLLTLLGIVGAGALAALQLPAVWPAFFAGIFIGAACRDLGFAIKAVKAWPVQSQLMDWKKIEEIAGTGSINSV